MKLGLHEVARVSYEARRAAEIALGVETGETPTWENAGDAAREEQLALVRETIDNPAAEIVSGEGGVVLEAAEHLALMKAVNQAVVDALR